MEKRGLLFFSLAALLSLGYVFAYTTTIRAPAVLSTNNGVLTTISLNLTGGNGFVNITGPSKIGQDTEASAATAAQYASTYAGVQENKYNFTYNIADSSTDVTGPSAGLAFTLLGISALEHLSLPSNFTVTGTINTDGSIGEVGGVYDKIDAAESNGMKFILVPVVATSDPEYLAYYTAQQQFGMPVQEVSNVSQALGYLSQADPTPVKPLQFNLSKDYHLSGLRASGLNCTGCNISYFAELTNYTLGFVQADAESIGAKLSPGKENILSNIETFRNISSKGYLYTAADLAFLQYQDTFVLANANNLTTSYVQSVISGINSTCSNLIAPQLTGSNYEYIIGGEIRQQWAKLDLENARSVLNSSASTDDLITSLFFASQSGAWCNAANEMYNISSAIGGSPVAYSSSLKDYAYREVRSVESTGAGSLYAQAAVKAYNRSEYGAAIYDAVYATNYAHAPGNLSNSQLISGIDSNAANATFGIWPLEFANSALFYAYEANAIGGAGKGSNLTSAYTISQLASNLSKANKLINSSLVSAPAPGVLPGDIAAYIRNQTAQLQVLQGEVSQLYGLLLLLTVIMGIIAVLILVIVLRKPEAVSNSARRRKG